MIRLFRKLLKMPTEEILFRLKEVLVQKKEELCFKFGCLKEPQVTLRDNVPTTITFENPWLNPDDQQAIIENIQSNEPVYMNTLLKNADAICNKQFEFFGKPFYYPETISWLADPVSDTEWPLTFHTLVDIFSGDRGNGDVKYVWELNRHQFLPTLGKAYLLTGDEKYVKHGLDLMSDWVRSNPYKLGINWTSALEVAVRALSWMWACALFQNSPFFDSDKRKDIQKSLYQHGTYLEQHLSFYFSPYNHLIGEASALFFLGTLFPEFLPAYRWKEKGWGILEKEMPKQFHLDGGTVEQASGYHHFTLGFYLQAILLRRHREESISSEMWSLFEKTFEFSLHLMQPDGAILMIGDGDEGKALDLSQTTLWDFRCFLLIGAVLFQRSDLKKMSGVFLPDVSWLFKSSDWKSYQKMSATEPKETSKAFPQTGYYIMRTGWDTEAHCLHFDCGEISDGLTESDEVSAAHGHADLLSFEISSFGKSLLIDPGFYTYNGAVDWHRYFRETAAHNTVVIDDQSQAKYRGRLKWSNAPLPELSHWASSQCFDYVEGSHNGYEKLPQPVIHRRKIFFFKPDFWFLRDEFTGEGAHQIDRYFHFSPLSLSYEAQEKAVYTETSAGANLALFDVEKENTLIEIHQEGVGPQGGWVATGYEQKVRAPIAVFRTKRNTPLALHTLLIPFKTHRPAPQIESLPLDEEGSASAQGFSIVLGKTRDTIIFSNAPSKISFRAQCFTDAHVTWIREDEAGTLIACGLVAGSTLVINGDKIIESPKKIGFVSLSFVDGKPLIELSEAVEISSSLSKPSIIVSASLSL